MEDVKSAVRTQLDKYVNCMNNADAPGVAELHTDDCKVLPPNSQIVEGSKSIETMIQHFFTNELVRTTREDLEIEVMGPDFALASAIWTFYDKAGQAAAIYKDLMIWKKVNGTWKLHRGLYNSN